MIKIDKEENVIKLDVDMIKAGVLRELTGNEFKVFMTIASFMNEKGECDPSQERIASLSNLALSTVSKTINSIIKKKIRGKAILKRQLIDITGGKKYSAYSLVLDDEEEIKKRLTPMEILNFFQDKYKEVYKIPYKIREDKDCFIIRKALMANYTDEQIKEIITIAIEEYDKRWKNPKFPSITVGSLCSWIAQEALKIVRDREKQITDRTDKYADLEDDEDINL